MHVCLLLYTSIVSTNLRQLERCPAEWSDCYTATYSCFVGAVCMLPYDISLAIESQAQLSEQGYSPSAVHVNEYTEDVVLILMAILRRGRRDRFPRQPFCAKRSLSADESHFTWLCGGELPVLKHIANIDCCPHLQAYVCLSVPFTRMS